MQGITLERAREWLFTDKAGLSADEKAFIRRSHLVEEQQRKGQRNRLLGFVAALVVVAGLAVWQALSATEAEKMVLEANAVINFASFELRDQPTPPTITNEIRTRVTDYFKSLGNTVKSKEFLRQDAVSLSQHADTLAAQGNLPEAEPLYKEASQFMQQRADKDPSNTEWQRDLSVSLNKIGDILSAQGKLEEAKAVFEKGLAIAQTLSNNDPSNAEWKADLVVSHFKIMNIEQLNNAPEAARKHGEAAISILKSLGDKGLLHGEQQQWIGIIEDALDKLN